MFIRDGIIMACANFKGKAGLLQLNSAEKELIMMRFHSYMIT